MMMVMMMVVVMMMMMTIHVVERREMRSCQEPDIDPTFLLLSSTNYQHLDHDHDHVGDGGGDNL